MIVGSIDLMGGQAVQLVGGEQQAVVLVAEAVQ